MYQRGSVPCRVSLKDSKSLERSMILDDFDVNSIGNDLSFSLKLSVISLEILGETEFFTEYNGLSAGELELGSSEGLKCMLNVGIIDSD